MDLLKQVSPSVEAGLKRKVEEHNEAVGNAPSKRTNLRTLEAVFRRGVGAYNTNPSSVRPGVRSEEQWAYARVNSFLYVLRNGRFRSGKHDTDLLPEGHPLTTKSITKASYKPTQGMINAARRGLKLRAEQPPSNRGGTAVGLARARDIVSGKELSASTVLRMHSFFSRHAVDERAGGWKPSDDNYPSKGFQAHLLWGGSPGRAWSARIRNQIMRERSKEMNYDEMKMYHTDEDKMMSEEEKMWHDEMKMYHDEMNKAQGAMNHLLMAYGQMVSYTFPEAHELRAKVMEAIHGLEHAMMENGKMMHDDEDKMMRDEEKSYAKEIVVQDGQYCVRSADGSRNFGCYISRERAEQRLAQIESFASRMENIDTKNLMEAHKRIAGQRDAQTLNVISSIIDEELVKRLAGVYDDSVEEKPSFATIMKAEQRYTLGPVYVPGLEDAHGETIEADELQRSIWDWVRKGDRTVYLQHSDKPAGEMVEILTMPMQIETSLVVPGQGVTKYQFPENTPFMGVIWKEWAWEMVKAGEIRGYSIGGQAQRVEVQVP